MHVFLYIDVYRYNIYCSRSLHFIYIIIAAFIPSLLTWHPCISTMEQIIAAHVLRIYLFIQSFSSRVSRLLGIFHNK